MLKLTKLHVIKFYLQCQAFRLLILFKIHYSINNKYKVLINILD